MADTQKNRPVYRNIHISQIVAYRLPLAGIVSILHRVSGAAMFLLMPFIIWLFDASVTSDVSYARFSAAVENPLVKVIVLGLTWAFLHHLIAGVRHLWMDATHSVTKEHGKTSAVVTLALSVALTLVCAVLLFF